MYQLRRFAASQDTRRQEGQRGEWILPLARLGVSFRPFQADHFAAPAAGQRDLANDTHRSSVFLIFSGVAEHPTQYSILRFR